MEKLSPDINLTKHPYMYLLSALLFFRSIFVEETKEEKLARLKAEHPLVKDERCFILNWWPETEPNCCEDE